MKQTLDEYYKGKKIERMVNLGSTQEKAVEDGYKNYRNFSNIQIIS